MHLELDRWEAVATSVISEIELARAVVFHVATAVSLGADLGGLLTYELRMQQAVSALGLSVVAPR